MKTLINDDSIEKTIRLSDIDLETNKIKGQIKNKRPTQIEFN